MTARGIYLLPCQITQFLVFNYIFLGNESTLSLYFVEIIKDINLLLLNISWIQAYPVRVVALIGTLHLVVAPFQIKIYAHVLIEDPKY